MSGCLAGLGCGSLMLMVSTRSDRSAVVADRGPPRSTSRRGSASWCCETSRSTRPRTAIVLVVYVADQHWCTTYTARVANLVPRMNDTLDAGELGIQVVFSLSDVVDFYRMRRNARRCRRCRSIPSRRKKNAGAATAGSDGFLRVWTEPAVSEPTLLDPAATGLEDCRPGLDRRLQQWPRIAEPVVERGIDTLIYMGVASNMCVQYRSMGLRNMKSYGLRILVVADLVEAISSNGLDAEGKPNANFTPAAGSCASSASGAVLGDDI